MGENGQQCIESFVAPVVVGATRGVYCFLPAEAIRGCCDSLFPSLAKNAVADSASGYMHRFKAGHDLLTDVVLSPQNLHDKLCHAGHILLTDFPTKAGIPIPGLSQNGLGNLLVEWGIPRGWLCLNIADAGIGIMALPEGADDVMAAISGDLPVDSFWSFYDTFGEGGLQLTGAILTENPLLLLSAAENIAAGVISFARAMSPFTQLEAFFGSAFSGFAIGCAITLLARKDKTPRELAESFYYRSARSITWGALSTVSPMLSLGSCVGCLFYYFGKKIAQKGQIGSFVPEMANYIFKTCLAESPTFCVLQENRVNERRELHEFLNADIKAFSTKMEYVLHENCTMHAVLGQHKVHELHEIMGSEHTLKLHEKKELHETGR